MAVRIKEGMIPYTGGVGIEITNNHVINLLLREANNLIHVNENNEVYVDLQLDDGIQPDDDFPVGVTTGRILQEDGWQQSGLILNWKTTSGDYARLIYANDGNLYVDLGDGQWVLLMNSGGNSAVWGQITGYLRNQLDLAQALDEKVNLGDNDILDGTKVTFNDAYDDGGDIRSAGRWVIIDPTGEVTTHQVYTAGAKEAVLGNGNITLSDLHATLGERSATIDNEKIVVDGGTENKTYYFLGQHRIATLDDLNFAGAMTYKGNVNSSADLPSSGQQVGDCYYDETNHTLWAWDGSNWKDVGGTGIDLTNYFNMQVNTSDDITEGSIHLFCTAIEKNYWNSKQDALTAGNGIDITNDVISAKYSAGNNITIDQNFAINNDAPFEPSNAGTMGQFLQRTNSGYQWVNPNFVTSVNGNTGAVTVSEFLPDGSGVTGQFLQKTATGYDWVSAVLNYTPGTGININSGVISNTLPFNPTNTGSAGQVIKLNQDGVTYSWQNDESGGGGGGGGTTYYGGDYINITSSHYINNTAPFVPAGGTGTTGQVLTKTSNGYTWDDLDLPSGENNVKFWKVNSGGMTSSALRPIYEWVNADVNNGAILNDSVTQDAFIFNQIKTINGNPTAVFLGKKRNSEAYLSNKGYITTQWEWEIRITYSNGGYAISILKSEDDATKTNYISALPVGYDPDPSDPHPFIPTEDYEPATKKYVDMVAGGGGGGSYTAGRGINITNNEISTTGVLPVTTGTTSSCTGIWVGSAAEYALIQNPSATTLYIVFPT